MSIRSIALAALISIPVAAATFPAPAEARGHAHVTVRVAPPAPRYERVVVRPGHVWSAGYWSWNGHRHVWIQGHSVAVRKGHRYIGPRWVAVGPHWHWRPAYWQR